MGQICFAAVVLCFLISIIHCFPVSTFEGDDVKPSSPADNLYIRAKNSNAAGGATTRTKATTVTQSINNWIEDINTVDSFLNVALGLPVGGPLKAGASKALAFTQDEPMNLKLLKATPGIDADGLNAAGVLEKVFGDVLDQLGNVVSQPASLPVAVNAVARINVNRCKNVLPSAETLWRSAATAMNISTATWPPKANREVACPGTNKLRV